MGLAVDGWNLRKNIDEDFICVSENWMRENFNDRVKKWFLLKNGNLVVVLLEDDGGLDDYDKAKSINTMPSHFGSDFFSSNKMLLNDVIRQIGGSRILVLTAPIPILCIYTKKTGLIWLIMDSVENLLGWVKLSMENRVYFLLGF